MEPAALLRVLATDVGSVRDFQAYAALMDVELVAQGSRDGVYCHVLRKSSTVPPKP